MEQPVSEEMQNGKKEKKKKGPGEGRTKNHGGNVKDIITTKQLASHHFQT
jgi:hypothetical protein